LYGKKFSHAFNFGAPGNELYIGSLFSGGDGSVAAFMSTGSTDGKCDLVLNNATKVRVVSSFGVAQEIPVHDNHVLLDVPELPVYVELPPGQSISVASTEWGPNLARQPGVTAQSSADTKAPNEVGKIINGEFETWYLSMAASSGPWRVEKPSFPLTVEIDLPKAQAVSRVVIFASPPWQSCGSLLDYELQYEAKGKWITIANVSEPPKTISVVTPVNLTSVDSFYSDRWIFQHHFNPIVTAKVRLLIHDSTCGGNPTVVAQRAGGQGWDRVVTIREVEIYGK
jgi:hypothetical protein